MKQIQLKLKQNKKITLLNCESDKIAIGQTVNVLLEDMPFIIIETLTGKTINVEIWDINDTIEVLKHKIHELDAMYPPT
jgi:hypothetical protein